MPPWRSLSEIHISFQSFLIVAALKKFVWNISIHEGSNNSFLAKVKIFRIYFFYIQINICLYTLPPDPMDIKCLLLLYCLSWLQRQCRYSGHGAASTFQSCSKVSGSYIRFFGPPCFNFASFYPSHWLQRQCRYVTYKLWDRSRSYIDFFCQGPSNCYPTLISHVFNVLLECTNCYCFCQLKCKKKILN